MMRGARPSGVQQQAGDGCAGCFGALRAALRRKPSSPQAQQTRERAGPHPRLPLKTRAASALRRVFAPSAARAAPQEPCPSPVAALLGQDAALQDLSGRSSPAARQPCPLSTRIAVQCGLRREGSSGSGSLSCAPTASSGSAEPLCGEGAVLADSERAARECLCSAEAAALIELLAEALRRCAPLGNAARPPQCAVLLHQESSTARADSNLAVLAEAEAAKAAQRSDLDRLRGRLAAREEQLAELKFAAQHLRVTAGDETPAERVERAAALQGCLGADAQECSAQDGVRVLTPTRRVPGTAAPAPRGPSEWDAEWECLRAEVLREEAVDWEILEGKMRAVPKAQAVQGGVVQAAGDALALANDKIGVIKSCGSDTIAEDAGVQSFTVEGCKIEFDMGDQVGKGAYGTIFRGSTDGVACAVKRIQEDGQSADMYAQCALALAEARGFDHPNVVRTLALGRAPGVLWHVMGLANCDLEAVCGKLPLARACRCAAGIAAGVAYLHAKGLVHRDLKTSNILMYADEPRVCDFDTMVHRGFVGGKVMRCTWAYTSPEVVRNAREGKPEDTPRDVYALGLVAYCLVQGTLPPPLLGSMVDVVKRLPVGAQWLAEELAKRPDTSEVDIAQEGFFAMTASGNVVPDVSAARREARIPMQRCVSRDPSKREPAQRISERFTAVAEKLARSG
eukprot:TRINITY_DN13835_c1_g1_i7.p1 TRINITY_DN13835_c1_g1~~TRINITY_DN13835_c1_g1_i7.p1  ORF type:complete len:682 (+),score=152.34 TRINITY_DN13835_c1_g1_i7:80-2125(+)